MKVATEQLTAATGENTLYIRKAMFRQEAQANMAASCFQASPARQWVWRGSKKPDPKVSQATRVRVCEIVLPSGQCWKPSLASNTKYKLWRDSDSSCKRVTVKRSQSSSLRVTQGSVWAP